MAYGLQDVITLRQMQGNSGAEESRKRLEQHKLDAMLGLCELTTCRRQALLRYFDDVLDHPCGNCDNCLTPPETWDATVAAQKALSCVYRTGQRFGVSYLVDVLMGKEHDRISQFGHDKISTYGIGTELNATEWRTLYRQIIARGLLRVDVEGHGSVQLTDTARPILKGETLLTLRKMVKVSKTERRKAKAYTGSGNAVLWEALREHRKALASEQEIPAYMIFHDATLAEMSERQPQTLEQLSRVSGVGQSKLDKYGAGFLEVILANINAQPAEDINDTTAISIALLKQGANPDAIASERKLALTTVYGHLSQGIASGELKLSDVVTLSDTALKEIQFAFEHSEDGKMKPIYEMLDGEYDYNVLKCVKASLHPN